VSRARLSLRDCTTMSTVIQADSPAEIKYQRSDINEGLQ
jgi:hypothetical protein